MSDYQQLDMFAEERKPWILSARLVAKRIAMQQGQVTADDIWQVCPPPAHWRYKNAMAAVFSRGMFKCTGYKKSNREECHHRPIGIFELI